MNISPHLFEEALQKNIELLERTEGRRGYFKYKLSCGHEKNCTPQQVRNSEFRCDICLENKLTDEAKDAGCKILAKPHRAGYRVYQLPCGHEQELTLQHVRDKNFRCHKCMHQKLSIEAVNQDCFLIGEGTNAKNRTYRLPCGHHEIVHTGNMRYGTFSCKSCIDEKHKNEAEIKGLKLIADGRNGNDDERLYRLPCGHDKYLELKYVRLKDDFACSTCTLEKHKEEAEKRNCRYLSKGRNRSFGKYKLGCCGHVQEITIGNMRVGDFVCRGCDSSFYNRPTELYLFAIKLADFTFLKFGYSASPQFRATRYGLPKEAEIELVFKVAVGSGEEGLKFEKQLKDKFIAQRLDVETMRQTMKSGFTECYSPAITEELVDLMNKLSQRDN